MKQYSFYNTDLLIDGNRVDGFANANDIIRVSRNVPQHNPVMDAYGKLAVTTSADMSGSMVFPLLQTADWNDILYTRAQLTQATGLSGNKTLWEPIQAQLVDKMGDLLVTCVNGAILKQPDVSRGSGITRNNWVIYFEKVIIVSGSYPEIGV